MYTASCTSGITNSHHQQQPQEQQKQQEQQQQLQSHSRNEIDFTKLSRNRLINDLYGYARVKCQKQKQLLLNQELQQQQHEIKQHKQEQLDLIQTQQQQQQAQQHQQSQCLQRQQTYNEKDEIDQMKRVKLLDTISSSTISSCTNTNMLMELEQQQLLIQQHQKQQQQQKQIRQNRRNSSNYEQLRARTNMSMFMEKRTSALALHPKLHEKLEFVINEGILDAVLPYICPIPVPNSSFNARPSKGKNNSSNNNNNNNKDNKLQAVQSSITNLTSDSMTQMSEISTANQPQQHVETSLIQGMKSTSQNSLRRKSIGNTKNHSIMDNKETEVVIHVVDEVKNSSKDFTCPQSLLIQKMCYFADVTAGQKLDDMDISVHCDIQIFDWLMRWVKNSANIEHPSSSSCCSLGTNSGTDPGPQLDACNVVPILVSANFLQMEPLLLDCLSYCHAHLNDVVRMSTSLSCLNDAIITRLAAMFTNLELEGVRDKKERVTPRLWTKLISSLCEPETEALRGHYYSLAGLFRCSKCGKCLTNTIKSYINCVPNNIRLNRWGQLVSHHVRDTNWEINLYITQLFRELKSWRRVYWKLWGHCHFLYCCVCETHFPVYQMTWCRYHPDNAIYLGAQIEGRLSGPTGRYPCCSQQAFRYDPMPGPNGCQFREHSVLVGTDRERAILAIAQVAAEGNVLCELPSSRLREAVSANDIDPRWLGLCLTPTRGRPGLLPSLNPEGEF